MIRILLFLLAVQFASSAAPSKVGSKFQLGEYCEQNGELPATAWGFQCLNHRWVYVCSTGHIFYDEVKDCSQYGPTVNPYYTTPWTTASPITIPNWSPFPPTTTSYPYSSCSPFNTGLIRLSGYENLVFLACDQKPINGIQTCVVREPTPFKK